jgi:hypothetical protein
LFILNTEFQKSDNIQLPSPRFTRDVHLLAAGFMIPFALIGLFYLCTSIFELVLGFRENLNGFILKKDRLYTVVFFIIITVFLFFEQLLGLLDRNLWFPLSIFSTGNGPWFILAILAIPAKSIVVLPVLVIEQNITNKTKLKGRNAFFIEMHFLLVIGLITILLLSWIILFFLLAGYHS